MLIAIAARVDLLHWVRESTGGGGVEVQASESKEMRNRIYRLQPDVLVIDELAANDWRPLASVPRIRARCKGTRVIALLEGITQRKKRMAVMAGCFDGLDVSDSSWPEELSASLEVARRRMACDLDARRRSPVAPLPPRISAQDAALASPSLVAVLPPELRVVRY
jgi:hypothetical protein